MWFFITLAILGILWALSHGFIQFIFMLMDTSIGSGKHPDDHKDI